MLYHEVYSYATRSVEFSKIEMFAGSSDCHDRMLFQTSCAVHAYGNMKRNIIRSDNS